MGSLNTADITLIGLAGLVGALVWWWLQQRIGARRWKNLPAGSMGWPLLGETLEYLTMDKVEGPVNFVEKRRAQYGDLFKTNILGKPTIVSTDAEVNKFVLQNEGRLFQSGWPKSFQDLVGKGSLINMHGDEHKRFRGYALSCLGSARLKHILNDIEDTAVTVLAHWKNKDVVYVAKEAQTFTFTLVAKQLLSLSDEEVELIQPWYDLFTDGLFSIPIKLPGTGYSIGLKGRQKVTGFFGKVIQARRSKQRASKHKDLLDFILQDEASEGKQVIADEELQDYILGLLLGGHDTTASLITMIVKLLKDSPKVLHTLKEEHKAIKKSKRANEKLAIEDYKNMSFTQNVISEALRIANIAVAVFRTAKTDVEIKGYTIPKGWTVLVSLAMGHFDSKVYTNPFQFDPWRWQDKTKSTTQFAPFGGGPKLCVGADLARLATAIFLHYLLTQYSWEPTEKDYAVRNPIFRFEKGLPIIVKPEED